MIKENVIVGIKTNTGLHLGQNATAGADTDYQIGIENLDPSTRIRFSVEVNGDIVIPGLVVSGSEMQFIERMIQAKGFPTTAKFHTMLATEENLEAVGLQSTAKTGLVIVRVTREAAPKMPMYRSEWDDSGFERKGSKSFGGHTFDGGFNPLAGQTMGVTRGGGGSFGGDGQLKSLSRGGTLGAGSRSAPDGAQLATVGGEHSNQTFGRTTFTPDGNPPAVFTFNLTLSNAEAPKNPYAVHRAVN